MKYIALWLVVAGGLGLAISLLAGGYYIVKSVQADPSLGWIGAAIIVVMLIATVATAVDYLSEHRKGPEM